MYVHIDVSSGNTLFSFKAIYKRAFPDLLFFILKKSRVKNSKNTRNEVFPRDFSLCAQNYFCLYGRNSGSINTVTVNDFSPKYGYG